MFYLRMETKPNEMRSFQNLLVQLKVIEMR